jgi:hypothetical protein
MELLLLISIPLVLLWVLWLFPATQQSKLFQFVSGFTEVWLVNWLLFLLLFGLEAIWTARFGRNSILGALALRVGFLQVLHFGPRCVQLLKRRKHSRLFGVLLAGAITAGLSFLAVSS